MMSNEESYETSWAYREGAVSSELLQLADIGVSELEMLVRCWDSEREPCLIRNSLASLGFIGTASEVGVVYELSGRDALEAIAESMFGFDEIWIGSRHTNWSPLRDLAPMTADVVCFAECDPSGYISALEEIGAIVAFGDGDGVNIVCSPDWKHVFLC